MKVRLRISLRLFLLLTILCAAAMGWFTATYLQRYRHEAAVLARLSATGGQVDCTAREPEWLWSIFGHDVAQRATALGLSDTHIGDLEMIDIGALDGLEGLYLDRTAVTDFGMAQINDLHNLVGLSARQLAISNSPPLRGMTKLIELNLSFTDVAYVDTSDLQSLEMLNLRATRINDDSLAVLSPLPKLKTLDIAGAPGRPVAITDRGLVHLTREKYPKLTRLYLYDTEVSDGAVVELKARMPGLAVYRHETVASGQAAELPKTPRPAFRQQ